MRCMAILHSYLSFPVCCLSLGIINFIYIAWHICLFVGAATCMYLLTKFMHSASLKFIYLNCMWSMCWVSGTPGADNQVPDCCLISSICKHGPCYSCQLVSAPSVPHLTDGIEHLQAGVLQNQVAAILRNKTQVLFQN